MIWIRLGLMAGSVLGLVGLVLWLHNSACDAKQNSEQLVTVEERNEIRNNRPDDDAFFNSLLRDANW